PDAAFEAEVYPGLVRYAEWLLRTRDADHTGMIDVVNQYETGQEFMSRYQTVDPEADRAGWESRMRLKGVDVTVYGYRLLRALERFAGRVTPADVARWREAASRTGRAILEKMWDSVAELFFDVNRRTARPTGVKAAVCFYPFATDLVDARHVDGLGRHLFDAGEFWTPYPVPSSSVDDLIVSHVMGVLPDGSSGLTVWPLALGVERATLDHVRVAGRRVSVTLEGKRFRVKVDERRAGEGRVGEPLPIVF